MALYRSRYRRSGTYPRPLAFLSQLRVLFALIVATVGLGTPGMMSTASAQTPTVFGLGGTTLTSSSPNATRFCEYGEPATFTFATSGTSSGGYTGTFVESGTVSLGPAGTSSQQPMTSFSSSFTIDSPSGQVTGTKWLVPGSSSQNLDSGTCQPLWDGSYRYTATAWNLRYEATIVTPDGQTCTAVGSSILQIIQNSSVLNDSFSETFYNDVANPYPTCTGGGGQTPPGQPATKEDCKDGGWEAYGFENQGQCIKFLNEGG